MVAEPVATNQMSMGTSMPMGTFSGGTTSAAAPVMTTIGSSGTYGAAQTSMPAQTYAAPTTAYSGAAPAISSMPATTSIMGGGQMYGTGGSFGAGAYKLAVSIIQAQNLKHLNNFTGDKPYVVCEVKHNSFLEKRTMAQTKEVTYGDTTNPVWNECLELEPWHPGEKLVFTIYDKGLLGSRTEGKAELPGEMFFTNPNGWTGALNIENHPEMLLYVEVRVLGPYSTSTSGMTYSSMAPTTSAAAPVMTTIGSSGTYGTAQTSMPAQTYAAPTTAYSGAAPSISSMPATANMMGGGQMYGPGGAMQTVLEPVATNMMGGGQMGY
jgi:hypothetical protein